ncbi:cytosolic phospholipase A2 epsilon-like [Eublepharis macularius]|uniref:Phospholipase A2 n=1 Tax=Eublepharis macularius TaxID=481883 RepID=A0AA97IUN7_EUBMA|nr:cytosolic phospholipase A2 epsilon-like [Eublepharis macularius]
MGANSSSPEGLANNPGLLARRRDATPFRLLTVRIVRARNIQKADPFTESDCYVTVSLPTASSENVRTATVYNSKNPVWNQSFCYRIDSRIKNVLELKICDEDTFTKDDDLHTVLFDIAKLHPGKTSRVTFKLNPQTREELEVEFKLQYTPDYYENIVTNGVLVSREISCLEIKVHTKKLKQQYTKGDLILTVKGSYEDMQKIPLTPDSSNRNVFGFHCIKSNQSNLEVTLPKMMDRSKLSSLKDVAGSLTSVTVPLFEFPVQGKIEIEEDKTFDLQIKARDCFKFKPLPKDQNPDKQAWHNSSVPESSKSDRAETRPEHQRHTPEISHCEHLKHAKIQYFRAKALDVRLANDLSAEEKNFLLKRRKYVATALKKALQLQEELQDDEVPVVAIMTTGGGTRSFTAMYGSLLGLQKLNLLDCITYITGLSGATWTMVKLYEDANWSQKYLEEAINEARKQVSKSKIKCFSIDHLKYYYNELKQRRQEGHQTSFIDLWGLVLESMLYSEKTDHKLSYQRAAVNEGQNPLPIYTAIHVKNNYSVQEFKEWLEFSPYEVGNLKYGAYIRSEHFGSKFFMGRLMKKLPEIRICFMLGMWSSIFSMDFMYLWNLANDFEDFWCKWTQDRVEDIDDSILPSRPHELETRLVCSQGQLSHVLREFVTGRPSIAEYPNFLKGFQIHDEYLENKTFSTWKDTVLDSHPIKLLETAEQPLSPVDTGFFINTSYPPLLRPERKVDIILHFNYSDVSQTMDLDRFVAYASEQGIPFPKIEISEEDRENLKECYVFDDTENPAAPVVLFFPLTNDTFKKYKAPGEERDPTDMKEGNVDVSSFLSPFTTREITFSEENFDRLVKLTDYNILNNEDKIVEALRAVVKRKKQQKP